MRCGLSGSSREDGVDVKQRPMRLAKSGAREAGIAGLRVASSVQRAIRKDVYDAER
jgi:hypothetical protein